MNRTAGALVPVFVVVGIALDGLMAAFEARTSSAMGKTLAWGLCLALLALSTGQNYNLVFKEYQKSYEQSAWNTSEMGQAIRNFGRLFGTTDTAWVLTVPYWVDTRLVGINAGEPTRDFAIWSDQLEETLPDPRAKLFIVKLDDQPGVEKLQQVYPNGVLSV